MTRKQYNNIVQWTLSKYSSAEEDSLAVCRAILKNLGIPFPNGDYQEVLRTLMSNEYMGWNACTMEQAIECTDQGIPAIGISKSRVLVLAPNGIEEPAIDGAVNPSIRKALAPSLGEISLDERMDMQFFAYAEIENGVMQLAGRTVAYFGSPRYIQTNESNGAKIRKSPNGEIITEFPENSVLLVNNPYPTYAATKYWIDVTYFVIGPASCKVASGWIAAAYTKKISIVIPDKSAVTNTLNSELRDINQRAMLTNALYVRNYFRSLPANEKWSDNAIYAMLGNMIEESSVNPNYWQDGKTNNMSVSYGLTQWNPPTKFFNWLGTSAASKIKDIDKQLEYIKYEVKNTDQWQASNALEYMSFEQFTQSLESVSTLAEYFTRCYERPRELETQVAVRKKTAQIIQQWIEAI